MTHATRTITIEDPVGIHARPASQLAQTALTSAHTVTIAKNDGNAVNACSMLSIMSLGIQQGDTITINVEGEDAQHVLEQLTHLVCQAE